MPEWMIKLVAALKGKNLDALTEQEKSELAKFAPAENPNPASAQTVNTAQIPATDKSFEILSKKIEDMNALLLKQEEEKKALQMQMQEQAKKDLDSKIEAKLKEAIEKGKIAAKDDAEKTKWKTMFEKDFDGADFALGKIPDKITNQQQNSQQIDSVQSQQSKSRADLIAAAKESFKK